MLANEQLDSMNCISNSSDHIFSIWKLCITTWIFFVLITFPNSNVEDNEILAATRLREGATENDGQVALTGLTTTSEEPSQRFKLLPNGYF